MRLSAMGDVAMIVPTIRAFVKKYPEIKVTVISRPFFKPFFDKIPGISFFSFEENTRHKGSKGLLLLFLDLKKLDIDYFADLHNVIRSKFLRIFFSLIGKKTAALDKGRDEKEALTRAENKIFKPLASVFSRQLAVFESLGFTVDLSEPEFPPKATLALEIKKLIDTENKTLIGIAPFAQYDSKVYPLDLMQQVINTLASNSDYKIILFGGGEKESSLLDSLLQQHNNVVNIVSKISFEQELQLISNLDIMLSMDSGNAHIAAMFGVKVISLWGGTHPFAGFTPFNQPTENSLIADREKFPLLPTSVYGNIEVEGYGDAMRTIPVEAVVSKIIENLGAKTESRTS